jgi:peroxiredoxin
MKYTHTLALLLSVSCAFAQKQPAGAAKTFPVKIEGTITNFGGKYIYLHHRVGEKNVLDSARVTEGKFSVRSKLREPDIMWFTPGRDPASQNICYFFADETPMKASLKGDSLAYSSIEGGQPQKDFLEYRAIINNLVSLQMRMQNDFNDAIQRNDVNTQNAIRNEYQNLNGQYLGSLRNYIRSHPSSVVSAYIIQTDLNNPNIPVQETLDALASLDKSIENHSYVKQANQRMERVRGTMVGYPAINFTQATPEGKKISLTDFRGKYVLIDFWASWCRPCRMENPNVVAAFNRYKDKGFTVLGVSMDDNKTKWVTAIEQDNLTWTHVSDLKGWGNEVGKLYGVTGIPQNYLLDKEGKILAKDLRGPALEEKLAELLK